MNRSHKSLIESYVSNGFRAAVHVGIVGLHALALYTTIKLDKQNVPLRQVAYLHHIVRQEHDFCFIFDAEDATKPGLSYRCSDTTVRHSELPSHPYAHRPAGSLQTGSAVMELYRRKNVLTIYDEKK